MPAVLSLGSSKIALIHRNAARQKSERREREPTDTHGDKSPKQKRVHIHSFLTAAKERVGTSGRRPAVVCPYPVSQNRIENRRRQEGI